MGLFGKIDTSKKVNVKLLTIISLIPFVCIYSFLRIKKGRKMLALNAIATIAFVMYLLLRYDLANQVEQTLQAIQYFNYLVIPAIDAIFIYKWAKQYNKEIDLKTIA